MSWSDVPGDTPLLLLWVPDPGRFERIHATAFFEPEHAMAFDYACGGRCSRRRACDEVREEADLPPGEPAWSGSWLVLTKDELAPLRPDTTPWVHLRIEFGEQGSHWALVHWNDEDAGFELHLGTWNLRGLDAGVSLPEFVTDPPLCLVADAIPENPERLFVTGDGGAEKKFRYDLQVQTYMLAREHGDELVWDADNDHGEYERYANLPDTTTRDDGTIVTVIKRLQEYGESGSPWCCDRVTYTRMFRPGEPDAAGGAFGQWYPVLKTASDADPVIEARGSRRDQAVQRAFGYLRWVADNAPGRVREIVVVSHATVEGPTGLGAPPNSARDFDAANASTCLGAIAQGGVFWVTGCNSNGGTLPEERGAREAARERWQRALDAGADEEMTDRLEGECDELAAVRRQRLADLEGTTRAYLRLIEGAGEVLALHDDAAAWARAGEVFGTREWRRDQRRSRVQAPWQLPGPAEGELAELRPSEGDRTGKAITRLRDFEDRENTILRWTAHDDSSERAAAAREAIAWIVEHVTWEQVKTVDIDGHSVGVWLDRARRVLSSELHYVAGFARMAGLHGRSDIRAYGGVPGVDGQHLSVEIEGGDETTFTGEISAYRRSARWSACNMPWALLFFRRLGFATDHPLWYLDYSGRLDAEGRIPDRPGTDRGYDHTSREPWPP